ncbi:PAS domain S-box-containing protein [Chitinophaga niastensis]|uniref:histidine kinase n=1 Tax=Chitinophaga niastensis TaxID=536980 RepID=A0A2P8HJL7_CHINA|nr:ATP-binding protein [Chitinophaga niastensis]PSL46416.1 PAS domain S-box-containing protein [Chitinophaga niastensis]
MLATTITGPQTIDPGGEGKEETPLSEKMFRQQKLLEILSHVYSDVAAHRNPVYAYENLLQCLLDLTDSEYGFTGAIRREQNMQPWLHSLAIANVTWSKEIQTYYHTQIAEGLNFTNCHTLFRDVINTGEAMISNTPATDEHSGAFPPGHPELHAFLGLPIIFNQQLLGVVELANKTGGYNTDIIAFLQPLLQAFGSIMYAAGKEKEYRNLENEHRELTIEWDILMTALDDIVFELNEQKIFTKAWCNQESLLFRPKEEVLGKTISELLGEHSTTFNRMADKLLITGEPQEFIYQDIRPNLQHWYELKMYLIKSRQSSSKRILLLIRNISTRERKHTGYVQSQSELRRSNQLLDISQQMGKMGGWEFNVITGEMYWTKEIYELREVPTDLPISFKASSSFYHPDDRPVFVAARDNLIHNKVTYDLELRHISAKGKETWVRTVGRPVTNNSGMLTHFRGIIMDITAQKDAELELVAARDSAQKAAQSRSEFLSIMSHEIRTPLNAIIGIAGILENNPSPEHTEVIQSLQFSANHLLGLINDILDFSKMEAGKIELENILFDPTELLQGIARNFQPLAKGRNIKLYTAIDNDLPKQILGDPVRLSQILHNLVNNAIKFTYEGAVCLEMHREDHHDGKCRLTFTVRDTGIGIAPEMHEKIFDTFVQEDSATTRNHGGTGLGLAITKKLVELYQGTISLESKKGEGTIFRFTINFHLPENQQQNTHKKSGYPPGFLQGMNLLVVEDNSINIRIIELQLKKSGAAITTAINGKQALHKLHEQQFDGIILDLHMPEMNGYETIPHIKKLQPNTFIIVLTADVMHEVPERLASLEVKDMLPKPYAADDLLHMLHKYAKKA